MKAIGLLVLRSGAEERFMRRGSGGSNVAAGATAWVDQFPSDQFPKHLPMPLRSLSLHKVVAHRAVPVIASIPGKPQPFQVFQDLIAGPRFDARGIEVFDAQ
jgi:hypothetical protein